MADILAEDQPSLPLARSQERVAAKRADSGGRLGQLDALRPFAILSVLYAHWLVGVAVAMIAMSVVSKLIALGFGYWLSFYLLPWQLDCRGAGCLLAILSFRNGKRNQFDWITRKQVAIFGVVAIAAFSLAAIDWYIHRGGA